MPSWSKICNDWIEKKARQSSSSLRRLSPFELLWLTGAHLVAGSSNWIFKSSTPRPSSTITLFRTNLLFKFPTVDIPPRVAKAAAQMSENRPIFATVGPVAPTKASDEAEAMSYPKRCHNQTGNFIGDLNLVRKLFDSPPAFPDPSSKGGTRRIRNRLRPDPASLRFPSSWAS